MKIAASLLNAASVTDGTYISHPLTKWRQFGIWKKYQIHVSSILVRTIWHVYSLYSLFGECRPRIQRLHVEEILPYVCHQQSTFSTPRANPVETKNVQGCRKLPRGSSTREWGQSTRFWNSSIASPSPSLRASDWTFCFLLRRLNSLHNTSARIACVSFRI